MKEGREVKKEPILLTPTLSGDKPGTPLHDYFVDKLPPEISKKYYDNGGLTCLGWSRLIMKELGGPEKARIVWLASGIEEDGHAFVIPNDAKPTDLAYNNTLKVYTGGTPQTAENILRDGIDITEEILDSPW